jgi:hypothetical protein
LTRVKDLRRVSDQRDLTAADVDRASRSDEEHTTMPQDKVAETTLAEAHGHRRPPVTGAGARGAGAVGALAMGVIALGVLAIGRLAIARMSVAKVRVRHLEVDDLTVRRLRVLHQMPSAKERRSAT